MRRPISADSVIMHPSKKIIALKSKFFPIKLSRQFYFVDARQLQMFDIEQKAKLKSHMNSEDVVFWKWINEQSIGLVTETSVFHWHLEGLSTFRKYFYSFVIGPQAPVKVFDRHSTLKDCQIITYKCDVTGKLMLLQGIAAKDNRVVGSMQLYSEERKVAQPIEGHASCFVQFKLESNPHPSNLFCFAARTAQNSKVDFPLTI